MKVGAYSTLIVAVILGVVLTTSLMVPVIANVDSGQTEERLVPTEVNSKEYYNYVGGIGYDGSINMPLPSPYGTGDFFTQYIFLNQMAGIYTSDPNFAITEITTYWIKGSIDWTVELEVNMQGVKERVFYGSTTQSELYEKYTYQDTMWVQLVVINGGLICDLQWADGTRIMGGFTQFAQGKIVGYAGATDQRALNSGYTLQPTTQAYVDTYTTTSGGFILANAVTIDNTLVGYTDDTMTTPIYAFNENGTSSDLFVIPYGSGYDFLGLNEDKITIYEKKDVPVDSPIKWVLAIIPVMVLVGIVVFVINTQIVQKRD